MAFAIEFTPVARDHIRLLQKRDQQILLDAIAVQLMHQPYQPTSHRKRLESNALAPWELRIGDHRVFYDIRIEEQVVIILAVGHKSHNRLLIGGEEIEL